MSRRSRVWLLAIGALVVLGGVMAARAWRSPRAERPDIYGAVPDFRLVERSGRTVTRSELLGKVSVVDFFYTRCTDACPLQSAHLARLQADFSGVADVLLVSVTVDPDHDSPAVLSAYATRFQADRRRWLFLTGPREAIYRLAVDGFHLAAIASRRTEQDGAWAWIRPVRAWAHGEAHPKIIRLVHASRFALVDRHAQIRGYFDGTDRDDVNRLSGDLKRLLGER